MASTSAAAVIECSAQPLDLSFHPSKSTLVAAALVDGTVEVHDFADLLEGGGRGGGQPDEDEDDEIDSIVSSTHVHTQLLPSKTTQSKLASARCCAFSSNGSSLYSGGTAGDFVCLNAERISTFSAGTDQTAFSWSMTASKSPLHTITEFNPNLVVTGDDAGCIRIYDVRLCSASQQEQACVHTWKNHDDYISGFDCSSDGVTLVATSADCTLSVYDLRANVSTTERLVKRSDDMEDELLSVKIIKNGKKVVCGTGEGVLAVFSWGTWGDVSDRFRKCHLSFSVLQSAVRARTCVSTIISQYCLRVQYRYVVVVVVGWNSKLTLYHSLSGSSGKRRCIGQGGRGHSLDWLIGWFDSGRIDSPRQARGSPGRSSRRLSD
jgi:WD40 repeat protein